MSYPLVARQRSVDKRLRLPYGAFETTGIERVSGAKRKVPGLKIPSGYAPIERTIYREITIEIERT